MGCPSPARPRKLVEAVAESAIHTNDHTKTVREQQKGKNERRRQHRQHKKDAQRKSTLDERFLTRWQPKQKKVFTHKRHYANEKNVAHNAIINSVAYARMESQHFDLFCIACAVFQYFESYGRGSLNHRFCVCGRSVNYWSM